MFQTLGNLFSLDNRAVQIVLIAIVAVVIFAAATWVYRVVFAHRLRPPSTARGRAPRLGVVDVFTLDAQRQLVIVRRDNVEHLLMIGGPNDLVVEPQIVRGAQASGAGREAVKPATPAEPAVEPAPPAAAPAPPRPVAPPAPAPAARRPPPRPIEVAPPTAPTAPAAPVAAAPEPAPPPVRPAEPVAGPRLVETTPEPKSVVEPLRKPAPPPRPVAPRPNLPSPIGAPRAPAPELMVEPPKPAGEIDKAPEVAIAPPLAPLAPAPPPLPPAAPADKPKPRADDSFYDLESLEAEMARLLGRE